MFYILLLAFVLVGGTAVLYTQGWRLDFSSFTVRKVGAIFIKSLPEGTDIHLNNQVIKNKSWLLQSGTFIGNLFPKTYRLQLSLDGYKPWQANVRVFPALVSEIKYAVLVPSEKISVASGTIKDFRLIDDNVIIQQENGALIYGEKTIPGNEIVDLVSDQKKILTYDGGRENYFLVNLRNDVAVNLSSALSKINFRLPKTAGLSIDPTGNSIVIFASSSIYSFDVSKKAIRAVIASSGPIRQGAISRFWFVWTESNKNKNSSRIIIYDKFLDKVKVGPTVTGKIIKLRLVSENKILALQDNGDLLSYEINSASLKQIASDVKNFEFNSSANLLAALENKSLEIFSSNDENYWRFNLPDISKAEKVLWHKDDHHLFIQYPEKILFLDVDKNYQKEPTEVALGNKMEYYPKSNQLYFLENSEVWKINFPQ